MATTPSGFQQHGAVPPKYGNSFLDKLQPKPTTSSGFIGPQKNMSVAPSASQTLASYGSGNKDVKSVTHPDGTKIDLYSDNKTDKKPTTTTTSSAPKDERTSAGLLVNPVGAKFDRNTGQPIASATPSPTTSGILPTTSADKFDRTTGQPNPNYIDPNAPRPPQVGSTTENAQNVLNTGNLTDLERERMARLDQAGQMTPEEFAANEEVRKANELQKSYQNVGALSPYAEAGMYSDRARTPEEIQNIQQAPDLAGRAASTYGLTNSLSNIYGSSRVAGANAALQGVQTAAGRGLSAAQSGLGGAQTQAGRAQGVAGTVFNSSLVTPTTPGLAPFSGLGGYQGGAGQFGDPTDPASQANYQSYIKAVGDNNLIGVASTTFNQNFDKAISDAQQVNSILTPEQRKTPIESLMQLISNGVFGTSPVLSGLVNDIAAIKNSYKQATGNDLVIPPTATLDQLSSIRSSAQSAIKAAQAGNQKLIDKYSSGSSTPSSSSTGGSGGLYDW